MNPWFVHGAGEPLSLTEAVRRWALCAPNWPIRWETEQPSELQPYFIPPNTWVRTATAEDVAQSLLNDPDVQAALAALASPVGEAIEQAVASAVLPEDQAKLLAEALTVAWEIAGKKQWPAWLRVTAAAGGVILLGVLIVLLYRQFGGGSDHEE